MKLIIIFLFLFTVPFYAQDGGASVDRINSEFSLAVNLFETKSYDDALQMFNWIVNENSYNSKTTASYIFISKIFLNQNKQRLAENSLKDFLSKFPQSKFIEEAKTMLADINLKQKEEEKSVALLIEVIDSTKDNKRAASLKEIVMNIFLNHQNKQSIEKFIESNQSKKIRAFLFFVKANLEIKLGQNETAKNTLKYIIENFGVSDEFQKANQLHKKLLDGRISDKATEEPVIAVLLPLFLNSNAKEGNIGREILSGVKFAVDEFNRVSNRKIGIVIRDTERSENRIIKIISELEKMKNLKAIFGPVYSDEVRYLINNTKNISIPKITPTATDNDLVAQNENLYQANPSFEMRGKVAAQFVYFVENKKRIGILSASDNFSSEIAKAFKDEFTKLGGSIILEESYKSNSTALGQQVAKIKNSIRLLDGLFIPIADGTDGFNILSELSQQKISISIFGNQDWTNVRDVESFPILSSMILVSDFFIDYESKEYLEFNKNFYERNGFDVNRNVLFGYDAATFLIGTLNKTLINEKSSFANVVKEAAVKGYHNDIHFASNRINSYLNIIRFKNGKFELIDRFKYEE